MKRAPLMDKYVNMYRSDWAKKVGHAKHKRIVGRIEELKR